LRLAAFAIAAFLCAAGQEAEAGCYGGLGFLRNSIFAEKGYCFRKTEYRELFANTKCRFDSVTMRR
jgi:hypothetical protein